MKPETINRLLTKFTVGDNCWDWIAGRTDRGYSQLMVDGKMVKGYRVVYELLVGPIPEGSELDHLCRNTSCVRPSHLEPVTHAENCRRGLAGRKTAEMNRAKTRCPQGHPYEGDNLYLTAAGHRACKECRLNASRRHRSRKAAY